MNEEENVRPNCYLRKLKVLHNFQGFISVVSFQKASSVEIPLTLSGLSTSVVRRLSSVLRGRKMRICLVIELVVMDDCISLSLQMPRV